MYYQQVRNHWHPVHIHPANTTHTTYAHTSKNPQTHTYNIHMAHSTLLRASHSTHILTQMPTGEIVKVWYYTDDSKYFVNVKVHMHMIRYDVKIYHKTNYLINNIYNTLTISGFAVGSYQWIPDPNCCTQHSAKLPRVWPCWYTFLTHNSTRTHTHAQPPHMRTLTHVCAHLHICIATYIHTYNVAVNENLRIWDSPPGSHYSSFLGIGDVALVLNKTFTEKDFHAFPDPNLKPVCSLACGPVLCIVLCCSVWCCVYVTWFLVRLLCGYNAKLISSVLTQKLHITEQCAHQCLDIYQCAHKRPHHCFSPNSGRAYVSLSPLFSSLSSLLFPCILSCPIVSCRVLSCSVLSCSVLTGPAIQLTDWVNVNPGATRSMHYMTSAKQSNLKVSTYVRDWHWHLHLTFFSFRYVYLFLFFRP